ncbi:glycosyltransferase family 4 protein [Paraclostridium ghonii]|uniref:Glycosyltransferase involved in cell wall biosynthesis n=1 Tax=Paraclostridium ghonii TaxID=29358 RepID=A0ABU0N2X2_9FIRM|nr:glycosyltransferase family 4 protein [Paeniclostridium ghonii]MDQ0557475.1 glycosyltransferase involved in cell wall biosynthesis [Paeniclostridium ghonii]
MKILHIITQKPNSTGSGIYMCGMINGFKNMGYKQGVIAGLDASDSINCFDENINFYPVIYNSEEIPFSVVGMSDVMPYNSTLYKNVNEDMVIKLKKVFKDRIDKAIKDLKPDLIICHHLYLITAFTRDIIHDIPIVGICHGTCLKQFQSHNLYKDYIKNNICKLDMVFSLHNEQRKEIINIFGLDKSKVFSLGSGYDENMFFYKKIGNEVINITFAGKICRLKGVESLIKSLKYIRYKKDFFNIDIVGDGSDEKEFEAIKKLSDESKLNINFLGKVNQNKLAEIFRDTHIFVLPSFFEGLPLVVIEALASGCNVITTDIPGVSEWIGEYINSSGKIKYIKLPKMEAISKPFEYELPKFEENLGFEINNMIDNILKFNSRNKNLSMKDKTWQGLCTRLENFTENL